MSPLRDGATTCARYALPTTDLRYCGPDDAPARLRRLVRTGEGAPEAARALASFEALTPYLGTLARGTARAPLDPDVVDAYWLGNALLDRPWRSGYEELLDRLARRGLPRSLADALRAALPDDAKPHHTFHVLFVGVGAVTGHVETTLPNMDKCRISWGRVVDATTSDITVERRPLAWRDGAFALAPEERVTLARDHDLLPDVDRGDVVSVHWGVPVERLDAARAADLARWTERSLRAASAAAQVTARMESTLHPAPASTR